MIETLAAKRINELLARSESRRYLEIGVEAGRTFRAVDANQRVGVDPRFRFEIEELESPTSHLIATTSDGYFSMLRDGSVVNGPSTFDVVYVDGLHTVEQTYRDVNNALSVLAPAGVVLVDDVIPSDVYSSLLPQARAVGMRKLAHGRGEDWHGDVYKLLFLIHDFRPELSYRLIPGPGNAQALVWSGGAAPRVSIVSCLSDVASMDFFDLIDLRPSLVACTFEEALASLTPPADEARLGVGGQGV